MTRHSLVVVDDHELVRAGLVSLIQDFGSFEVVAQGRDGADARRLAAEHLPALMVLDVTMPGQDGIAALPGILQASPATRVLVLSMHCGREIVVEALRRGAHGYLIKDVAARELQAALDALARGQRYLSPSISSAIVEVALGGAGPAAAQRPAARAAAPTLTARQLEVLRLLAGGKAAKEIAFDLGLSVKTVEAHRAQIMERLGIRDLPRLVLYAVRHGLVDAGAG